MVCAENDNFFVGVCIGYSEGAPLDGMINEFTVSVLNQSLPVIFAVFAFIIFTLRRS